MLSVIVDVATGLTPPPGIQEDRALRLFTITLCADGLDLGAGARRCFPLAVRNVRPLDGSSLRYRVEAPLPVWVAPWVYDLTVRFPGAQVALPRAVLVREDAAQAFVLAPRVAPQAQGLGWPEDDAVVIGSHAQPRASTLGSRADALIRVHVSDPGLLLSGGSFRGFPLPDAAGGFAAGFVALVQRTGRAPVSMTKRQGPPGFSLALAPVSAEAGRPVQLTARGAPPGALVFWWLDPARGALGSRVTTVFLLRGSAPLELAAVATDGRSAQAQVVLPIWQRRSFGCTIAGGDGRAGAQGSPANCFMLLGIACLVLSCSRRGARFAIAPPRTQPLLRLAREKPGASGLEGSGGRG
jgi:hypothetical protein